MNVILGLQEMDSAPAQGEAGFNSSVSLSWPCPTSTLSIHNC